METILENDTIEYIKWFKKLSKRKKEFASVLMIPNVDVITLKKIQKLVDVFNNPLNLMNAYEQLKNN